MKTILLLERTSNQLSNKLYDLTLSRHTETGKKLDQIIVNSGQGYNQVFLKAGQGMPENNAPLEEGLYDLGPLEWAGGEGNYNALFPAGVSIGPTWVDILPDPTNITRRSALGIHLDGNRDFSPGTSGCIGLKNVPDLKKYVSFYKDQYGAPTRLIVNWGLGTVKVPDAFKPDPNQKLKVFFHHDKLASFLNDKPINWSLIKLMHNNGKLGAAINYELVDLVSAEVKLVYKVRE